MMAAKVNVLTVYFLISLFGTGRMTCSAAERKDENRISFIKSLEIKLENKISECVLYLTECLESFNDEHLGSSELGRFIHYEEIKSRKVEQQRGHSKKGSSMMPQLMFHVGTVSTWMLLTTILTVKSLAVGLLLLVFKIAVSSAKVAAYFTSLKSKSWDHHESSWTPHYDHSYSYS